jgi:hypothetical protein
LGVKEDNNKFRDDLRKRLLNFAFNI